MSERNYLEERLPNELLSTSLSDIKYAHKLRTLI